MKPAAVYEKFNDLFTALGPFLAPFQQARQDIGLEPQEWGTLAVAHDFAPDPASAARFAIRNPYAHPQNFTDRLDALVAKNLMTTTGDGAYTITDAGHQVVAEMSASLENAVSEAETLSSDHLERIVTLLRQVVEAALHAEEPAAKPCLIDNRSSDPGPDNAPLYRFLQYTADLGAFRDDAHLAAWRPLGVTGPAWEALSFIWNGEAATAAELVEQLPNRNLDAVVYENALAQLVAHGWVTPDGDRYTITPSGKAIRDGAEALTNRYFYDAWDALGADEIDELAALLDQLTAALAQRAEAATA